MENIEKYSKFIKKYSKITQKTTRDWFEMVFTSLTDDEGKLFIIILYLLCLLLLLLFFQFLISRVREKKSRSQRLNFPFLILNLFRQSVIIGLRCGVFFCVWYVLERRIRLGYCFQCRILIDHVRSKVVVGGRKFSPNDITTSKCYL